MKNRLLTESAKERLSEIGTETYKAPEGLIWLQSGFCRWGDKHPFGWEKLGKVIDRLREDLREKGLEQNSFIKEKWGVIQVSPMFKREEDEAVLKESLEKIRTEFGDEVLHWIEVSCDSIMRFVPLVFEDSCIEGTNALMDSICNASPCKLMAWAGVHVTLKNANIVHTSDLYCSFATLVQHSIEPAMQEVHSFLRDDEPPYYRLFMEHSGDTLIFDEEGKQIQTIHFR